MNASPGDPFTLEEEEQLGEPRKAEFDPTGFYLSDMIGLVGWFAILFAMVRPILPHMPWFFQLVMAGGIAIQMAVFLISVANQSRARRNAINQGKKWLGISMGGRVWWFWPRIIVGFVSISLIIVIQSFAALMVISCAPFGLLFYLLTMWMPWNSGRNFARVRFGHMAKAIEFFENGIIVNSIQFVPWQQVRLKWWPSVSQRLTVITYTPKGSPLTRIYEVEISESLRSLLVEYVDLMDENQRFEPVPKPDEWDIE